MRVVPVVAVNMPDKIPSLASWARRHSPAPARSVRAGNRSAESAPFEPVTDTRFAPAPPAWARRRAACMPSAKRCFKTSPKPSPDAAGSRQWSSQDRPTRNYRNQQMPVFHRSADGVVNRNRRAQRSCLTTEVRRMRSRIDGPRCDTILPLHQQWIQGRVDHCAARASSSTPRAAGVRASSTCVRSLKKHASDAAGARRCQARHAAVWCSKVDQRIDVFSRDRARGCSAPMMYSDGAVSSAIDRDGHGIERTLFCHRN